MQSTGFTVGMAVRFTYLVEKHALSQTSPEEDKELDDLQELRRQHVYPRTPREVACETSHRVETARLLRELAKFIDCTVCNSCGFTPSKTGKGCEFCDGTHGGNPPEMSASARLDFIYAHVDEMLRAGKFSEVDAELATLSPDTMDLDELFGYLTITLAADSKLTGRDRLYAAALARTDADTVSGLQYGLVRSKQKA